MDRQQCRPAQVKQCMAPACDNWRSDPQVDKYQYHGQVQGRKCTALPAVQAYIRVQGATCRVRGPLPQLRTQESQLQSMPPTCGGGHSKRPGEVGVGDHHGVVDAPVGVPRPGVHHKQLAPQVVPVVAPAEAGVQPAGRTCSIRSCSPTPPSIGHSQLACTHVGFSSSKSQGRVPPAGRMLKSANIPVCSAGNHLVPAAGPAQSGIQPAKAASPSTNCSILFACSWCFMQAGCSIQPSKRACCGEPCTERRWLHEESLPHDMRLSTRASCT